MWIDGQRWIYYDTTITKVQDKFVFIFVLLIDFTGLSLEKFPRDKYFWVLWVIIMVLLIAYRMWNHFKNENITKRVIEFSIFS